MNRPLRNTLVLATLALVADSTKGQAQTTINTIPGSTGFNASTFSVGQSFTAPTDNVLTSFAVQLEDPTTPLTLSVYAYDSANTTTVGSALFTSAPTAASTVVGRPGYAFDTGNLTLTTGSIYAALLTGASHYSGLFNFNNNIYAGGSFLNGNSPSAIYPAPNADLAFRATFLPSSVPEPGSLALLAGLGVTGTAFLRRRKMARKAA